MAMSIREALNKTNEGQKLMIETKQKMDSIEMRYKQLKDIAHTQVVQIGNQPRLYNDLKSFIRKTAVKGGKDFEKTVTTIKFMDVTNMSPEKAFKIALNSLVNT